MQADEHWTRRWKPYRIAGRNDPAGHNTGRQDLVIVGFSDRKTAAFYGGRRVPAFSGFDRTASRKLDQLDAATGLGDLARPGNRLEKPQRPARGAVEHSHQRPMADLLPVAGWKPRPDRSGNRGLPLRWRYIMRDPIHPGETLREDLDALGMSAAELARRIEVAGDPR